MPKKTPEEKPLTTREEQFCQNYAVCFIGVLAAIDAGYSKKSAYSIASENLRKPKIRARIEELLKEKVMSRDEVLARLAEQARATLYPFVRVDHDGFIYFNFADPEALKHLHLIKKIKSKRERKIIPEKKNQASQTWEGEWVEVELHDPQKALELIGKHHSLFIDRDEKGNPIQPIVNVYMPNNGRDQDGGTG
jgi:phage terminase small subunit